MRAPRALDGRGRSAGCRRRSRAGAAAELAGAAALDAALLDGAALLDELHAAIVVARATAVAAPSTRRRCWVEIMNSYLSGVVQNFRTVNRCAGD